MSTPTNWPAEQLQRELRDTRKRNVELGDEVERLTVEVVRVGRDLREEARLHSATTDVLAEALTVDTEARDAARAEIERLTVAALLDRDAAARARSASASLVEEIGADGPESVDEIAVRAVRVMRALKSAVDALHDQRQEAVSEVARLRAESVEMRAALVRLGRLVVVPELWEIGGTVDACVQLGRRLAGDDEEAKAVACPHISTTMRDEHGRAECFACGASVGPDRVEDADPEVR